MKLSSESAEPRTAEAVREAPESMCSRYKHHESGSESKAEHGTLASRRAKIDLDRELSFAGKKNRENHEEIAKDRLGERRIERENSREWRKTFYGFLEARSPFASSRVSRRTK
ncbi:hypothetical protein Dimus_036051 [Dionaea muscipula]